jgi:outer membrane protein TolC
MGYHHSMQGLADQKLAIEKKKFELGLSLVDTLLEAQKDKTDAAIQAASAELDYIQACLRRDALLGRMSEWVNL